jgi:hypothetical protein
MVNKPYQLTNAPVRGAPDPETSPAAHEESAAPPRFRTQNKPLENSNLSILPLEVRHEIYGCSTRPIEFQHGLLALAKTAKSQRADVLDFIIDDPRGLVFRQMLLAEQASQWHTRKMAMLGNADKLRAAFSASAKRVSDSKAEGISGQLAIDQIAKCMGVKISLSSVPFNADIGLLLSSVQDKPVKIDASGIGRARYLGEVMPALERINPNCALILDVSNNQLQAEDLLPLTAFIKKSPIIYQLNLSENLLCAGKSPCLPLLALFELRSPLSHLYLSNTGFNDASAQTICVSLRKNPCLMHLDLRNNVLTEAGALAMISAVGFEHTPDQWHVNDMLTALRMQKNNFSMTQKISRAITCIQSIIDQNQALPETSTDSEQDSDLIDYVIQVDGISAAIVLDAMVSFYQESFTRFATHQRL